MAFDQTTRNRLQRFVNSAREILSEEFTRQLQAVYGMDPKQGTVADISSLTHLNNSERQTAHILRETLEHYLATTPGKSDKDRVKQVLSRIVREQAFTVLNRLAALRMAEARDFLLESVGKGQSSKGFQLYRQLAGTSHGETGDAYRNYLFSLFDEFSIDLAVLFDRYSKQGRLFPRESALLELLTEINDHEIEELWAEDETIGWIYQYFNSQEERKKMRAESQAPRNSRELAVRNQFFTPRYVVEFLTDNTLGRIWYEMTQGNTALIDSCSYLVRRPTEVFLKSGEQSPETDSVEGESLSQDELLKQPVYIPYRKLKDPRSIRMLDPACGSMHFGLYAFDLYEQIYLEAWQLEQELGPDAFQREVNQQALQTSFANLDEFKAQIPKLIIENNIHGVDIDPRAVQIAGLSLWQRAQRAWQQQGVKPQQRPVIVKSNIVCAEPMPGDKDLLKEFTGKLHPPALGQLVEVIFDKMELAGEAGTLLKIEEEIQTAINNARAQWETKKGSDSIGDLFQDELEAATPQHELGFNLYGIDNETFWDDAEQLILKALSDYADRAEFDTDQKRLFAEDAAKGFAFIDLCRKRFDVALMNPPFGLGPEKCNVLIKKDYPDTYVDLYASFVERSRQMCPYGLVGAITSRAFLTTKKLERWRKSFLIDNLNLILDLGLGVMDDAFVESCAYIVGRNITPNMLVFDNQEKKLSFDCNSLWDTDVYLTGRQSIHLLPSKKILYSLGNKFLSLLTWKNIFEPDVGTAREGMRSFDDERFLRLRWEVETDSIGKEKTWELLAKGGEFARYYSDIHLVVKWNLNGLELAEMNRIVNGQVAQSRQASAYYRRPGCTYSKRSAKGFSVRFLPAGCIIGTKGPAILSESEINQMYLLGWINSRLIRNLVQIQSNASEFNTGIIKNLPWIYKENKALERNTKDVLLDLIRWANFDETNSYFSGIDGIELGLEENYKRYLEQYKKLINNIEFFQNNWDDFIDELYEVDSRNISGISSNDEDFDKEISAKDFLREMTRSVFAEKIVQYIFGVIFSRWNISLASKDYITDIEFDAEPPNPQFGAIFDTVIPSINIFDGEGMIDAFYEKYLEISDNPHSIGYLQESLGLDIKNYFTNTSGFFEHHLKSYSKSRRQAPIYWPLQTPSGSYTLWVYYHRLNEQTLYTCINDFVEPKLAIVIADLDSLRNKSDRSTEEEKELAQLTDLEAELKDFRDELLRLAKFWKPNLNDGVQITAAPLWKLFQHKAWQKKLKETWNKLEQGEYDWAHLAGSVWPERVLRKCHQDRSLAIAHDVEDIFWHEVEIPIMRGKKPTGNTKIEWQPKALTDAELTALVKQTVIDSK